MASVWERKPIWQGSGTVVAGAGMMAPSLAVAHEMAGVPHHLHMEAIGEGVADLMSHLIVDPMIVGGGLLLSAVAVGAVRRVLQRKRQVGGLQNRGGRFTA